MKIKHHFILSFVFIIAVSGCATDEYGNSRPMTDAETGALIGAVAGAAIGMTQKNRSGNKAIIIGAAGGAIAGGLVGHYMDSQKRDLLKVLKDEVNSGAITIEKLPKDKLRINMTSSTAFEVNSAVLKPGYHSTLNKIANVLNRYGKTELLIVGHTDSTGTAAYNQTLSLKRANAVSDYLARNKVIHQRLNTHGQGESQPVASNSTEQGRRLNRRVEIIVVPIVSEEE
jgi:outer membrane protein OmpA-like peptidoglycan-associated protein